MPSLHQTTRTLDRAGQIAAAGMAVVFVGQGRGVGKRPYGPMDGAARSFGAGREWPGMGWGIRAPEADETPLSESEVLHYFRTL